jgi:RimJ/RimL family protein N-acetyltransferase
MQIAPVTLIGDLVRLEPLSLDHVPDLTEAGQDESIWQLMPYGPITTVDRMTHFVQRCLLGQERGTELLFAVVHGKIGRAVGSTRYLDIRQEHRTLEIGGTWYAPAHQRTGVNTECKYLLLRHAFEQLGCIRVQLKTDRLNERSQRAIERIGAVNEGTLRNHMIMPDGRRRDTVMYSVLDEEWPAVKSRLERLMARD